MAPVLATGSSHIAAPLLATGSFHITAPLLTTGCSHIAAPSLADRKFAHCCTPTVHRWYNALPTGASGSFRMRWKRVHYNCRVLRPVFSRRSEARCCSKRLREGVVSTWTPSASSRYLKHVSCPRRPRKLTTQTSSKTTTRKACRIPRAEVVMTQPPEGNYEKRFKCVLTIMTVCLFWGSPVWLRGRRNPLTNIKL